MRYDGVYIRNGLIISEGSELSLLSLKVTLRVRGFEYLGVGRKRQNYQVKTSLLDEEAEVSRCSMTCVPVIRATLRHS